LCSNNVGAGDTSCLPEVQDCPDRRLSTEGKSYLEEGSVKGSHDRSVSQAGSGLLGADGIMEATSSNPNHSLNFCVIILEALTDSSCN
jgi:hypothetical protein